MNNLRQPDSTLVDKVLELCETVSAQTGKTVGLSTLVSEILKDLKNRPQLSRSAPRVGHRHYDRLIETLFTITTTGIPREIFLQEVLKQFDKLDAGVGTSLRLILEAERPRTNENLTIGSFAASGIQQDRWRNYQEHLLNKHADSVFFNHLLFNHQTVEVVHSSFLPDYADEFKSLLNHKNAFWLNAIALPASSSHYPHRALLILYPTEPELSDKFSIPSNALQEWRVLHFTAIAYQHLSHQLASLAEQVAARRSALLNELAPGILHHEMGACLSLMRTNLNQQKETLGQLLDDYEEPLLDRLMTDNQALYQNAARLYNIVDTFNNLEQRRGRERVQLESLFLQLRTMCYHRLGAAGVQLIYRESSACTLLTDAALLLHLMLNIVINAINAIHEYEIGNRQAAAIKRKTVLLSAHNQDPQTLVLDFLNNGPPIDPDIRERLFQRGITSRAEGHGQGLYISRMIAHYLGGKLELLEDHDLLKLNEESVKPTDYRTGFRLWLPLQHPDYKDLDSERRHRKN